MGVTIKQISQASNVAVSTVSYVLSGQGNQMKIASKTQDKIMKIAKEMNYTPNLMAKNLRRRKTHTIGVVLNSLHSSWAQEVMLGINDVLFDIDYQPLLAVSFFDKERERKIIETFLASQVEALIIQPDPASADYYRKLITRSNVPVYFIGDCVENIPITSCMLDPVKAGIKMVDHLYELGHRKIALISVDHPSVQQHSRISSSVKRIAELGLDFPDEYLRTSNNASPEDDIKQTQHLLDLPNSPTAIGVVNDIIAYRVLSALHNSGRDDISVIGVGNLPESAYSLISLTTIDEPRYKLGKISINEIMQIIRKESDKVQNILLEGQLIKRKSTFRLKKTNIKEKM